MDKNKRLKGVINKEKNLERFTNLRVILAPHSMLEQFKNNLRTV